MRFAILLLLASALLAQQPQQQTPYFSLAGDWTLIRDGDAARTLQLPTDSRTQPFGHYRLERTLVLRGGMDEVPLAFLISTLRGAYRVSINGVQIGKAGEFDTIFTPPPIPAGFAVPPQFSKPGASLMIAIEVSRPWRWHRFNYGIDGADDPLISTNDVIQSEVEHRTTSARGQRYFILLVGFGSCLVCIALFLLALQSDDATALRWLGLNVLAIVLRQVGGSLPVWVGMPSDAVFEIGTLLFAIAMGDIAMMEAIAALAGWRLRWIRVPLYAAVIAGNALDARISVNALLLLVAAIAFVQFKRERKHQFLPLIVLPLIQASSQLVPNIQFENMSIPLAAVLRLLVYVFFLLYLVRRASTDRRERARLAAELEAARQVQDLLVSGSRAHISGIVIETQYLPAQEVGGDFFQSATVGDGDSALLIIGDVSGKGLKAAMIVSMVAGIFANRKSDQPAAVLREINVALYARLGGSFTTSCCVRIDSNGKAIIANAGHIPPYVGGIELEIEHGLPLGVTADAAYHETVCQIPSDGQLMLLSDGVVEASNSSNELFGFARTSGISGKSAQEIAQAAKAWGQNDDITVVTMRRST